MMPEIPHAGKPFEALQAYWEELLAAAKSSGRPMNPACPVPYRRDFNPMRVHRQLPNIFMLEYHSAQDIRFRLAGTQLEEMARRRLQGESYLDTIGPEKYEFFQSVMQAVVTQPCGAWVKRGITFRTGHAHQMHSLVLPLADIEGNIKHMVGMTHITRDLPSTTYEQSQHIRSTVHSFGFVDIGAGEPDLGISVPA